MPEAPKGGRKTRTYFVPCPAVVIITEQAYGAAGECLNFGVRMPQEAPIGFEDGAGL
jgi:hypothetical protein